MSTWFTSDTHFGHERIIELCARPFKSVSHMNAEIVKRWNLLVAPNDTVYHHGDVALGKIADSLPIVGQLNGYKILIEGNHDRPFMDARKPEKRQRWLDEYAKYFQEIRGNSWTAVGTNYVNLSHFPYDGDSHGADRYSEARIPDEGKVLIHGHTHSSGDPVSRSAYGSLQIHVGMDAWDFAPVHEDEIATLIRDNL